jgi:hypothetical protein
MGCNHSLHSFADAASIHMNLSEHCLEVWFHVNTPAKIAKQDADAHRVVAFNSSPATFSLSLRAASLPLPFVTFSLRSWPRCLYHPRRRSCWTEAQLVEGCSAGVN